MKKIFVQSFRKIYVSYFKCHILYNLISSFGYLNNAQKDVFLLPLIAKTFQPRINVKKIRQITLTMSSKGRTHFAYRHYMQIVCLVENLVCCESLLSPKCIVGSCL